MAPFIIVGLCLLLFLTPVLASPSIKPDLMLAKTTEVFSIPKSPSDYYVSEKLDGVRAFWDGKKLLTKQGNIINAPAWFTNDLPEVKLDGELWIERNKFEKVVSVIQKKSPIDREWRQIKYMVFDSPNIDLTFAKRMSSLATIIEHTAVSWLKLIPHAQFSTFVELERHLTSITQQGAEGLILNLADSYYTPGRQTSVLKLKPYFDSDAVVIDHIAGEGKFSNMLGSLVVRNDKGKTFKIGTGFTHEQRLNPPKIGHVVTFKYFGFTKNGIPKYASFLRERESI